MAKHTRRSLVAQVLALTNDGADIIEMFAQIATGGIRDEEGAIVIEATLADRMKAGTVLLDRGWGKPIQAIEATGADGAPATFTVDLGSIRYGDETTGTDGSSNH